MSDKEIEDSIVDKVHFNIAVDLHSNKRCIDHLLTIFEETEKIQTPEKRTLTTLVGITGLWLIKARNKSPFELANTILAEIKEEAKDTMKEPIMSLDATNSEHGTLLFKSSEVLSSLQYVKKDLEDTIRVQTNNLLEGFASEKLETYIEHYRTIRVRIYDIENAIFRVKNKTYNTGHIKILEECASETLAISE